MSGQADTDGSPFVGPRPFSDTDREMFFGRDREIAELLSLVVSQRVVVLYAVSGAGKTSLLTAGLVPALTAHGFDVLPRVRIQSPATPPDDAANAFEYATLRSLGHSGDLTSTLASFLAKLPREEDAYGFPRPRALIFDQFEELFTAYQQRWPDREPFMRAIAAALAADDELRVVFSLREEYVAQLERYANVFPMGLRARFHLERLRGDAALLAARGPVQARGISFAPGVAETLIHDLQQTQLDLSTIGQSGTATIQGEFVEPVHLQVICSELWRRRDPATEVITHDALAGMGGVDASLAAYYDEAVAAAAKRASVSEHKLRAAIGRELITSAGTRSAVFASPQERGDLPNAALDELASRHVIRADWRSGGRWLELSHDRLIGPVRESNVAVHERRRRWKVLRLLGTGLGVIVVLAVALAVTILTLQNATTVPSLVGARDAFVAEKSLRAVGLVLSQPVQRLKRPKAPAGSVIAQSPAAGTRVGEGDSVRIVVALDHIEVPSLKGLTLDEADRRLREFDLTLGWFREDSSQVVASQAPAAGLVVDRGTVVRLGMRDPP